MFQNESYYRELASLPAPFHEDVGTLAIFHCNQAVVQQPLLIWHCTRAIHCVNFGQRPRIHTISYLVHVIEIRQIFTLVVEV